jgi:5-methyltetrahydropteroyltriglutamate--homocysteine methyltransferase
MTVTVATLGFPRIGPKRELKTALESHWAGKTDAAALLATAAELRAQAWKRQRDLGATVIPSNDFSVYDHVLDTTAMVGAVPEIYGWRDDQVDLQTYFAMARGARGNVEDEGCAHGHAHDGAGAPAAEMTKWFDTNYHYLVPEFTADQKFRLASTKAIQEYREARALGIETRPVLLGPVSYLLLGKARGGCFDPLILLPRLLQVYAEVLQSLVAEGADWVQLDEPYLVMDLTEAARAAFRDAYAAMAKDVPQVRIMLATYFGALGDNLATALSLPVQGLHVDLVRAPEQLASVVADARADLLLSLGVIDGRNVWKADLNAVLDRIEPVGRLRPYCDSGPLMPIGRGCRGRRPASRFPRSNRSGRNKPQYPAAPAGGPRTAGDRPSSSVAVHDSLCSAPSAGDEASGAAMRYRQGLRPARAG